jgi:hypothetical protein
MKEFVKITGALVATGLGFAAGYLIGGPIFTQVMLWIVGEDGSNRELYSQLRNGLPGMLAAFTAAVATAAAFGFTAERLINRYGIPGLILPPAVDFRNGTVELTLALTLVQEGGQPQRVVLFERSVSAPDLDSLLRGEPGFQLVVKQSGGSELLLTRARPSPYQKRAAHLAPILVTLKERGRVRYSLEAVMPGKFRRPENQYVAFCRYGLRYVGCEEEVDGQLSFKGPLDVMKTVFLSK